MTGTHADSDNLNFDTDSEGDLAGNDFFSWSRNSPRGGQFAAMSLDDDEKESLVSIQPIQKPRTSASPGKKPPTEIPLSTYETLNLQSDSSDEEVEEIHPTVNLRA